MSGSAHGVVASDLDDGWLENALVVVDAGEAGELEVEEAREMRELHTADRAADDGQHLLVFVLSVVEGARHLKQNKQLVTLAGTLLGCSRC